MKVPKRSVAPAAQQESIAGPDSTRPEPAAARAQAAAVEVATTVARPRVSRRLTRPDKDCDREGLLKGKKALVFGVANDH